MRKLSFPSAYTVLMIVTILAAILTWTMPAGKFAKISPSGNNYVVTYPSGKQQTYPRTQKTLDDLGVVADIHEFKSGGKVYKPISIPGTYEKVPSNKQGIVDVILAPIKGIIDSIDIILFVLILGGFIGIIDTTGIFGAGIKALANALKGHELLLIISITTLIGIGGTTFGLAEETIAFYPALIPVFLMAGYDAIVVIASIYLGSVIGTTFSTVNPFSVIIASSSAGINFADSLTTRTIYLAIGLIIGIVFILYYAKRVKKDPTKSLVYKYKDEIETLFLKNVTDNNRDFDLKAKIVMIIFVSCFAIMIYGVFRLGWWFEEMAAVFLVGAIVVATIERIGEKNFIAYFIDGARSLLGVAFILGIARGVNIVMNDGLISGTIIYDATSLVQGMGPYLFVIIMLFVFAVLGFFIPSSSGLAVLTMPIVAPLADTVGIPRFLVINTYLFGQGILAAITPTGLILPSLTMLGENVGYDKWLKFIWPLFVVLFIYAIILLLIQTSIAM